MKRFTTGAVICLLACYLNVPGQTMTVSVNCGDPSIFQTKTGVRSQITASTIVSMGDSLILPAGSQVTLGLETNSRLIYKGPGILALTGDSGAAYLSFDKGQVFLDRAEPIGFSVLTFWVKNYMFVPVGTAAAIKVMSSELPAVAVIEGKMLMQSPAGESVEIPAGNFGCVDGTGRITAGTLGKKAIGALEKWSGVKAGVIADEAKTSSSLESIDQEFTTVAAGSPSSNIMRSQKKAPAAGETTAETGQQTGESDTKEAAPATGTSFELSAGAVTVNDQQWTRLALGIDVPIWKFGVFFDIETFLDPQGKFSNKGWDFKHNTLEAVTRKIRYIRFGHELDPVFVKVGGLSNVTFGHGFIVDRFTNMLHYPDQKLLGVQLYLNDLSPAGITLQLMGADVQELRDLYRGGVGAARLAFRPFKTLGYPIISNLAIGATYAYDRNMYAPARNWKLSNEEILIKSAVDRGILPDSAVSAWLRANGYNTDSLLSQMNAEDLAKKNISSFGVYGADLNLPLIRSSLISLDLYAQSGMRSDTVRGWGIGAPGVSLKVWRLSASLEYRHTEGRFVPGFFGPYYLDERLIREPFIITKKESLNNDTLNGVFGSLGFDIANVLVIDGAYQYLTGKTSADKDHRFEITGSIGTMILSKIPKIKKCEVYLYKTNIGSDIVKYDSTGAPLLTNGGLTYDKFFQKTPYLYYGYRLGFEISPGATLICDNRFGYTRDCRGKLAVNNNITVQTAFSF